MKRNKTKFGILLLILILFSVGCGSGNKRTTDPTGPAPTNPAPTNPVPTEPVPTEPVPTEPVPTEPVPTEPVPTEPVPTEPVPTEPDPIVSRIFVETTDGTDNGMERLIGSMHKHGLDFYQTQESPLGLIASDDVVLLKINSQWNQRGGTNTDLIRSVIQAVLDHPGGFTGEIIVADNGQGQFGSATGGGGSLSWPGNNNNAADQSQSVMHVINSFQAKEYKVTGVLWDNFTRVRVSEFSNGDMTDGFVVENVVRSTGLEITYPKFTTEYGTRVSFREGIWNANTGTYNGERLKIINMPVLKTHGIYHVTGAIKNYMGTPSDWLTRPTSGWVIAGRAHDSILNGGMGTQMAETRVPVLNITDMIWIRAQSGGPSNPYASALRINKIAASIDPVALDYWTAKHILMPEASKLISNGHTPSLSPDGTEPGTYGYWLRLSMNELHKVGITATMDESEMQVVENGIFGTVRK